MLSRRSSPRSPPISRQPGWTCSPSPVSPKEIWRQVWSNNPQERLNREIRRYLGLDVLSRSRLTLIPTEKEEQTTELGALSA